MDYINKFLYLIFLVFSTGSGIYLLFPADESSGSKLTQIGLGLIYIFILFYYTINYKKLYKIFKNYTYLILLLIWVFISISYSLDTSLSLRRAIALFGTCLGSFFFFEKLGFQKILYITVYFLGISLFLSIVFVFLTPNISTSNFHNGAWNGIYTHKNLLGRYSSMALITSIGILVHNWGEKHRQLLLFSMFLVIVISFICLFGSDSLTSIVTVMVSLSLLFVIIIYKLEEKSYYAVKYIGGGIALLLIGVIFVQVDAVIELIGKDITLTGRTYLWALLLIVSKEKFLFGHGYSGFWLGEEEKPSDIILEILNWYPSQAHNGYIEVYIQLGIVGLLLFMYLLFKTIMVIDLKKVLQNININIVSVMLMFYVLVYNLTEVSFLVQNSFMWFLFLVIHIQLIKSSFSGNLERYIMIRRY